MQGLFSPWAHHPTTHPPFFDKHKKTNIKAKHKKKTIHDTPPILLYASGVTTPPSSANAYYTAVIYCRDTLLYCRAVQVNTFSYLNPACLWYRFCCRRGRSGSRRFLLRNRLYDQLNSVYLDTYFTFFLPAPSPSRHSSRHYPPRPTLLLCRYLPPKGRLQKQSWFGFTVNRRYQHAPLSCLLSTLNQPRKCFSLSVRIQYWSTKMEKWQRRAPEPTDSRSKAPRPMYDMYAV